ncbi:MAG: hypothetical protein IJP07_04010, partial [Firmicutes bacterium]|nr:hypothetical protein [Bacillota bacterium]
DAFAAKIRSIFQQNDVAILRKIHLRRRQNFARVSCFNERKGFCGSGNREIRHLAKLGLAAASP